MRLVPMLVAFTMVAGCTSPAPTPATEEPVIVESPYDYSYLNGTRDGRPHLHDYWGGKTTVTVLDDVWQGRQFLTINGDNRVWSAEFLPPDGSVVPQGTSEVVLTVTPEYMPGDRVGDLFVHYSSASSSNLSAAIPFEDGQVRIPTTDVDNDLPHQVVSAWRFIVSGTGEDGLYRFTGKMHLLAEAVRGRPIPQYPGHPDQWDGASEIGLLQETRSVYDLWLEPVQGCQPVPTMADNCPVSHRPKGKALVPGNASYVEVTLDLSQEFPNGIVLSYHGADTRTPRSVEPAESSGTRRVYRMPVHGNGDGPYALRSTWEFWVMGTGTPVGRTVEGATYEISAKAFRDDPMHPVPFSPASSEADATDSGDSIELVFLPDQTYSYEISVTAKTTRIVVALYNGGTRNLHLDGPKSCDEDGTWLSIIGYAPGGNPVVDATCALAKGKHTINVDAGNSAFHGVIRLEGATFTGG